MTDPSRSLVIILGPPAVGKMSVGRQLARLTGFPLFHNHLSIEAVLPVFPFGSHPFKRLVSRFRNHMFEEVAASDLPGLIFTFVWSFDEPGSRDFVERLGSTFEAQHFRTLFVELWAPLEIRLQRNRTEERLMAKPSKRDLEASEARVRAAERLHRLTSDGDFPFPEHHLFIDNTALSVAERPYRCPFRPAHPDPLWGRINVNAFKVEIREAVEADLERIVALLVDDPLGESRESPEARDRAAYLNAFRAIATDPSHSILVAAHNGRVEAVLQLSFLPHLTYGGRWRAQVEGVRVSKQLRNKGVGGALLGEAITRARERGCHLIQLTTDRRRPEALEFYTALGFQPTHVGLKLHLTESRTEP